MSLNPKQDETLARLERGAEFLSAVEKLASYRLPEELERLFGKARDNTWISSNNEGITPRPEDREWHLRASKRVDETHKATCAAYYHYENVVRIESELDSVIAAFQGAPEAEDGAGRFYVGVTGRLSFEYHAFVFACVRITLHFATAVGSLFGRSCRNLKTLEEWLTLQSRRGNQGADPFLRALRPQTSVLGRLFSGTTGTEKSIRDRIAHEEFFFAGSLRIIGGEAWLSGTLKQDFQTGDESVYRLSAMMRSQLTAIDNLLLSILPLIENPLPRSNAH